MFYQEQKHSWCKKSEAGLFQNFIYGGTSRKTYHRTSPLKVMLLYSWHGGTMQCNELNFMAWFILLRKNSFCVCLPKKQVRRTLFPGFSPIKCCFTGKQTAPWNPDWRDSFYRTFGFHVAQEAAEICIATNSATKVALSAADPEVATQLDQWQPALAMSTRGQEAATYPWSQPFLVVPVCCQQTAKSCLL